MSLHKFELTDDHIKLLRQIEWDTYTPEDSQDEHIFVNSESPFGGDNIIQDMGAIIYGAPEVINDDPLNDELPHYSDEQIKYMKKLYNELPTALDVIMSTGSFEPAHYKTKTYERNWRKYTPKK